MKNALFAVAALALVVAAIGQAQPAHNPPCDAAKLSDLDEQADTVLGKEKRVLALLNDVSTWFTINPKNPDALEASRDLRKFYSSFIEEGKKMSSLLNALGTTCVAQKTPIADKIATATEGLATIQSQLRQVKAMGFELFGEGWVEKPGSAGAFFNEGLTALEARKYDVATAALQKAAEIDPNEPAIWANLGDAYMGQAFSKTGADFDVLVEKGSAAYKKSIALKSDDPGTHSNYGLALAKAKKIPEAEAELRKAAELDPASAFHRFYYLGALLSNIGQTEAATRAFKSAIDSAPDNPENNEAYYQYALSLAGQATVDRNGKFVFPAGTLEAFSKYLRLTPNGPNAQACRDMIQQLADIRILLKG